MNELWLPVVGYEGLYEVSSLGRVRSLDRWVKRRKGGFLQAGRVLKPGLGNGYHFNVSLYKGGKSTTYAVHSLVMLAHVGPRPDGLEIRHGIKGTQCNELTNLCFGTSAENKADMKRDGTHRVGEQRPNALLTAKAVVEIRDSKQNQSELARRYGVSPQTISDAQRGATWKHV